MVLGSVRMVYAAYAHKPWATGLTLGLWGDGVRVSGAGGAVPRSKKTEGVSAKIHVGT